MVAIMQALATPCPALPTAASALDASISACRNSISALESSLKATEGSSGLWETVAWFCSVVVAVGVAAEIIGIIWEYRDDLTAWRRGILIPPDRPSFIKFFWFEVFATTIVVAGIFGEARASKELSNINSQMRSKTSELRADSDQLLALITQEAGDANKSALGAAGAAHSAQQSVYALGNKVVVATREAAAAEGDREAALEQTKRLEAQLSWRTVTPEEKAKLIKLLTSFTGLLMPLSGVKINITYLSSDAEAQEYSDELKDALDGLGAEIAGPSGIEMMGGPGFKVPQGVIVRANPIQNLKAGLFLNALNGAGIIASGERAYGSDEHSISILVGSKPRKPAQ